MKFVIALDSFKGSIDAGSACAAAKRGICSVLPDATAVCKPMADGGEGTAVALMESENGEWIPCRVTGPLFSMQVDAGFVWFPETEEALVEMAAASGLPLLDPKQYNPRDTTTFGTGELIRAATCDGGMGAAQALGFQFLDKQNVKLSGIGKNLSRVWKIIPPADLQFPEMEVLCDVTNPLTGPEGAAAVYGPQKGATPEIVRELDSGLRHFAGKIFEYLSKQVENIPGAGAAGGLAAGAMAFMNARFVPGVEAVMAAHRLQEAMKNADWVVTGEGKFDSQSMQGKVVDGISRLALATRTRLAVIAGTIELKQQPDCVDWMASLKTPGMTVEEAISRAAELIEERAAALAQFAMDATF